jgi:membrane associated rhomboid family serine protease
LGAGILLALIVIASLVGFSARKGLQRVVLRPYLVARHQAYFSLITSGFVHADLGHLLFNAITFYSFAFPLERAIGTSKFLTLYFSGLLLSGIGTCLKHRDDPNYASLGASGAILAVLFASVVYFPHLRLMVLPLPVPIPGPLFALLYLGYTYYSSRFSRGQINHDAHLFGALAGVAFVAVTDPHSLREFVRLLGV